VVLSDTKAEAGVATATTTLEEDEGDAAVAEEEEEKFLASSSFLPKDVDTAILVRLIIKSKDEETKRNEKKTKQYFEKGEKASSESCSVSLNVWGRLQSFFFMLGISIVLVQPSPRLLVRSL